jgi:hypothetical protein
VEERQTGQLGSRGNDEIRYLAALKSALRQQPLDSFGPVDDQERYVDRLSRIRGLPLDSGIVL